MEENTRGERASDDMAQRLDLALSATETGVWEWNLETDEVKWSESLERLLGIEPGTFGGTFDAYTEYVHPDDIPTVERALDEALDGDGTFGAEFRMRREDGEQIWVRGRGELVDDDEERRIIGITTDITERKEREQKLKRQNERLDEFARIVSHELRNPLNVAIGNLELLEKDCDSEYLTASADALVRMDQIIDSMLTLAREGKDVDEVELAELREVANRCWHYVATGDADLDIADDLTISADPERLRTLLENLFHNAVTHGGEDVTVRIGSLDGEGFYVEDDGEGIPVEERDEVFEAGYSTAENGHGYGLAIVEQVVDAHGWEIRVTDGESGGARFEITGVTTER